MKRSLFGVSNGPNQRWLQITLAVGALVAYVLAFIPPYSSTELGIVVLATAPVLVAAWTLGFWGGLLAALLTFPFNGLLLTLTGQEGFALLTRPGALQGSVLVFVLGAVVGGLKDLGDQMRRELAVRENVEAAHRDTEERYRIVAETASDAIFTLDESTSILFLNPAAEKIFGYPMAELRERPISTLFPEHARETHERELQEYLEGLVTGQQQHALQLEARRRDGQTIVIEASFGENLRNGQRRFTGIVRNITERKRIETELKEAKEEAERANQAKSDFLSRMSHELRTPLNGILGFAQLLEMEELNERNRESVDQVLVAGRHLLTLVDEVLDIARIESGRMTLSPEPVHVMDVIDGAWGLVRPRAEQRNIRLIEEPGNTCDRYVRADRQRLLQVLLNLLSNAVKYNREGGTVTVSCVPTPLGDVQIRVADTGSGIPADDHERVFAPFDRLGAEETGVEGTGIGLSLSRVLVQAMGGAIGFESEPDAGATFWVALPPASDPTYTAALPTVEKGDPPEAVPARAARKATHDTVRDPASSSNGGPPGPRTGAASPQAESAVESGFTVLYVEDNPSNLRLLERVTARREQLGLITTRYGGVGLELAREERPDLVLLDLNLPDIEGEELLERLRAEEVAQGPRMSIVVLTARVEPAKRAELLETGADAFLTKPLDVQQFLGIVDELLLGRIS